jgi:hypothetical protein
MKHPAGKTAPASSTMAQIDLETLGPGMILAADVVESTGQVLLRAGTEIEAKHLRVLRSWGIEQVEIAGERPPDPEETVLARTSPEIVALAEAKVAHRFRLADPSHAAVIELRRLALMAEVRTLNMGGAS